MTIKERAKFLAIRDYYKLYDDLVLQEVINKLNKELMEVMDLEKNDLNKRMKLLDEILEKINKFMPTSVAEKKKYGEVFTPFNTVRKILDQLPIEVWNNPDLKWLDPCCGIGQFPVIIVQRLMEGLKEWEEDEEKRYKHIIENMLYVGELNPKNMWIFNNLFDRMQERKLKINFYRGDFLKDDFDKKIKETISTSPSNISRESPSSVRFIFPWFSIVVISS